MRTQAEPEEIADAEVTPDAVEKWRAALPPAVRAEIEGEADAAAKEMVHKFEMHAIDYEKEHPETAPKKND